MQCWKRRHATTLSEQRVSLSACRVMHTKWKRPTSCACSSNGSSLGALNALACLRPKSPAVIHRFISTLVLGIVTLCCLTRQSRSRIQNAVFDGCIVYVNGLTHPSAAELRDVVGTRGGLVEVHFETNVTHVVAENLPDGKIRDILYVPCCAIYLQGSPFFILRVCVWLI